MCELNVIQPNQASGIYIGGCVKNCNPHLPIIFNNISKIISLFQNYKIIIAYDESTDDSLKTLIELQQLYNIEIIINHNHNKSRTNNIANARNSILNYIKNENDKFEYFIMMDMDDVCSKPIDVNILENHLKRNDWDSLSFNTTPQYYDMWALSIDTLVFSCWHFTTNPRYGYAMDMTPVHKYKDYVIAKLNGLKAGELLDCYSAFNGFAIYRTAKFINCIYKWKITDNMEFITPEMLEQNKKTLNMFFMILNDVDIEDCEHRYFHFQAKHLNNARIKISPLCLFQ